MIPGSNNSKGEKMTATAFSVVVSFYSASQTKHYASDFGFSYWKYNLMVEVQKLPEFIARIKTDIEHGILLPEKRGVGFGMSGIFFETKGSYKNSSRMALLI